VVMTLPAIVYLDRWGRRKALLYGSLGMMLCLTVSGTVQAIYGEPNRHPTPADQEVTWLLVHKTAQSRIVIACSYLFVAIFATTWGPVSWIYPAEIFPTKLRTKAVSLTTASNWTWNCALAFAVPPLLREINWKMYIIFAVFNLLAFIQIFLMAPETKGRTLEEMDQVFDSGRPAWRRDPNGGKSQMDLMAETARQKQEAENSETGTSVSGATTVGGLTNASGTAPLANGAREDEIQTSSEITTVGEIQSARSAV
jgi:MFS family permease